MTDPSAASPGTSSVAGRVTRHSGADRVFHWVTAVCVLTLLATAFLPILGLTFDWIGIHWITGLVLIAAVLFHILRVLLKQGFRDGARGLIVCVFASMYTFVKYAKLWDATRQAASQLDRR